MPKEEPKIKPWVGAALAAVVLLSCLAWAQPARAAEEQRELIPMGRTVGIKLFSDGVMVVGFGEVTAADGNHAPARDCGLKEGDLPDAMLIDNRRRQGIIKRRVGNFWKVSGSLQNRLNRRTRSRTGRRRGEIVLSRIC